MPTHYHCVPFVSGKDNFENSYIEFICRKIPLNGMITILSITRLSLNENCLYDSQYKTMRYLNVVLQRHKNELINFLVKLKERCGQLEHTVIVTWCSSLKKKKKYKNCDEATFHEHIRFCYSFVVSINNFQMENDSDGWKFVEVWCSDALSSKPSNFIHQLNG